MAKHKKGEDRAGKNNAILNELMEGTGLIDFEEKIDFRLVANTIKMEIENGATVEEISSYRTESLKSAMSYFNIEGRSRITYKKDMAIKLIEVLGSKKDTRIQGTKNSKDLKDALERIKELEHELFLANEESEKWRKKYKKLKKKGDK